MTQKIFNSPINTSRYKNLYSFPKANRFEKEFASTCKQSFYNTVKFAQNERAPSFGYGQRIPLINKYINQPAKYETHSEFSDNIQKKKGYSFSQTKRKHIFLNQLKIHSPGPAHYKTDFQKIAGFSYTMGFKIDTKIRQKPNTVGPGDYQPQTTFHQTGQYILSQRRNSQCRKLDHTPRFLYKPPEESPGPANYNKEDLNKLGIYFNANNESSKVRSFGKQQRIMTKKNWNPGPGEYYMYTQFRKK